MGGQQSSVQWEPPPEPAGLNSDGSFVDYHVVAAQVTLDPVMDCCTIPLRAEVIMDCDDLYDMMKDQYKKGYRLLHFTRAPADMFLRPLQQVIKVAFRAYFRKNPTDIEVLDGYPITWQLGIVRSWVQSIVHDTGSVFSPSVRRVVHTSNLVDSINKNTQNGQRLIAVCVTGHCQAQTSRELQTGYDPQMGIDLFFEMPCPVPNETYVYNLALVPVHAEFSTAGIVFFPEIPHDWMATFKHYLDQGWRLVDIYIDITMTRQLRTHAKHRRYEHGKSTDTSAVWIFEKPKSREQDPTPFYEGTIMEQVLKVKAVNSNTDCGVYSKHNSMPQIQNMGSRGWELATVLECHSFEHASWNKVTLKSLLFFQRPLNV